MPNIISGRVGYDGSIWSGTGFEVEMYKSPWDQEEMGYQITFPDLKVPPIVIAQAWETEDIVSCVTITAFINPARVVISTLNEYNDRASFIRNTFSFIAVTVD